MVQWLIDSARGPDAEIDKLVTRMLFLNAAAIHTTAEVATNAILDLCARPEDLEALKEELLMVTEEAEDADITVRTLSSIKKMDSFIKESHRVNTLGLSMTTKTTIEVAMSNICFFSSDFQSSTCSTCNALKWSNSAQKHIYLDDPLPYQQRLRAVPLCKYV